MKTEGTPIFPSKSQMNSFEKNKKVLSGLDLKKNEKPMSPDYKVDLSTPSLSSPPLPLTPSLPKLESSSLPETPKEIAKEVTKKEAVEEVKKVILPKNENKIIKKDLIIFIKGLDLFSSPLTSEKGYAGLDRLANSFQEAKSFKWDEKDLILKEISRVHPNNKVILVGHSLGGDTAVEITNALDTLENKFRGVDLLVTIDSVGMNNDIIPQNVKNHLNVFGETNILLNDGPHVARNHEKTEVRNILSEKDHTEIDDDKKIQYEIVDLIKKSLEE